MNCNEVVSENIIERYLDGSLDEHTLDAFEEHYFRCESCLSMVQTVQNIRPLLTRPAVSLSIPQQTPRSKPWIWLAIAAALALVAVLLRPWEQATTASISSPIARQLPVPTPTPPDANPPIQLAEIQPAPYTAKLFRDASSQPSPELEKAMLLYQNRQWSAAAVALAPLAAPPLRLPSALHFAAISLLLSGQTELAIASFDSVIALGDQSPFEEEARFYRAQALLLANRLPQARLELDSVIRLEGDYEEQARRLRAKL